MPNDDSDEMERGSERADERTDDDAAVDEHDPGRDDDDDAVYDGGVDDDTDAGGKEPDDDVDVPRLKRELATLRKQLKRRNDEAKKHRLAQEEAKNRTQDEVAKQTEDLQREVASWKKQTLRAETRTALAAAGVTNKNQLARLVRMVDLDDLDLDDTGAVTGLDDQIEELRTDFPELFRGKDPQRRRAPELDVKDRKPKDTDPIGGLTSTSRRLLGRR